MKFGNKTKTALLCASLLGLSIPCFANEIPVTGNNGQAQNIQQAEAIVVRIEQNNVTLQAVGDKSKKITAPFSNASEFKVGDKVILVGNSLKKNDGGLPDKPQSNGAASDIKTPPAAAKM